MNEGVCACESVWMIFVKLNLSFNGGRVDWIWGIAQ